EQGDRLELARAQLWCAFERRLDLSENLDESEASDHGAVRIPERNRIDGEAHTGSVSAFRGHLQLRVRRAFLLLRERFSNATKVLGGEDAGIESAAQVAHELDRSCVLPANPPMAIHDVRGESDRLED